MAFTEADLTKLEQALASGLKKVTFADGRSREIQDASSLLKVRSEIKAELAASRTQIVRATRATMRRP